MNNFIDISLMPYQIIESLIINKTQDIENFWKLLKYNSIDSLSQPNLTDDEKDNMLWRGEALEQNYHIFLKPQIADSLESAESQTQLRLYRHSIIPTNIYEDIVCFEADFITNDKTCLVEYNGKVVERTDLLETLFLNIFHNTDIKVGSGYLQFSKELARSCQSLASLSNSKSLYGRSCILALRFNCRGGLGGDSCD